MLPLYRDRSLRDGHEAGKTVSTLGGAHYTASKAALQGLTRAAAKELGPYGITVNAICPGLFAYPACFAVTVSFLFIPLAEWLPIGQ